MTGEQISFERNNEHVRRGSFNVYMIRIASSLRSMAVLLSRAQERRSREKNKNRLPGFVAFSTAAPFNSF